MRSFRSLFLSGLFFLIFNFFIVFQAAAVDLLENIKNPQAVEEVQSGKRLVANAAWWGFDEEDSTDTLQAAINSGAKTLVIPNMGMDWVVRPLTLAGEMELVLEPGVVVAAKRGEYRGGGFRTGSN